MIDKITAFEQLDVVNQLLTNTHIEISWKQTQIDVVWIGYHVVSQEKHNFVYRAGIHKGTVKSSSQLWTPFTMSRCLFIQ